MLKNGFILSGMILMLVAVFAIQLGFDNDSGWGMGRIALILMGLAIVLAGVISIYSPEKFSKFVRMVSTRRFLLIAVMMVGIIYVWVAQQNIKANRKEYNYYGELARSFKSGQVVLDEEPSSVLLALENPYNYNLRVQAKVEDFPWDLSLYDQRFYLSWGPSPSLLLTVFSDRQLSQIGDRHLVAAFALGLFVYLTLMMMAYFDKSVPNAPRWLLGLFVLLLGLSVPTTIMLQESRVHQAAVFGCQFFFIGGCYWIYTSLRIGKPTAGRFVLAGLHWALAAGARITITPVILWSASITVFYLFKTFNLPLRQKFALLSAMGFPLLVGAVGLGWYNWIRFDSIFETGLKYQLTVVDYTSFRELFAVKYMGRNLYNYFFHPILVRPHFPYLFRIEYLFTSERMGGLLVLAPCIILGFLPVRLIGKISQSTGMRLGTEIITERWLLITLAGSAAIGLITILAYWWVEMRFLEDFMPSWLLFITVVMGGKYRSLENNIKMRRILLLVVTV